MSARLKLSDDAVVVQLPERSTFDEAWKTRSGQMKTRGDGLDKTRKLWDKAGKAVGHQRLLRALRAYLGQKEPTCGFCGLSVWLNGQKYDHWIPDMGNPIAEQIQRTTAPEPYRSKVEAILGDAFTISYLDPCTFHDDGWITPRTSYAREKLREKASVLKAAGLVGIRQKE